MLGMHAKLIYLLWLIIFIANGLIKAEYNVENAAIFDNAHEFDDVSTKDTGIPNDGTKHLRFRVFNLDKEDVVIEKSKVTDPIDDDNDVKNTDLSNTNEKHTFINTISTNSNGGGIDFDPVLKNQNVDPVNQIKDPQVSNFNPKYRFKDPTDLKDSNLEAIIPKTDLKDSNFDRVKAKASANSNKDKQDSLKDPENLYEDPIQTSTGQRNDSKLSKDLTDSNKHTKDSLKDTKNFNKDLESTTSDARHSNDSKLSPSVQEPGVPKSNDAVDPPAERSSSHLHRTKPDPKNDRCLTGYMTDVQSWVDEHGNLTGNVDTSRKIDVSSTSNPISALSEQINTSGFKRSCVDVAYLSLANNGLKNVPKIFNFENRDGKKLRSMVEYLTFFGNEFATISTAGEYFDESFNATNASIIMSTTSARWPDTAPWAVAFLTVNLTRLKELDLRRCSIQHLSDNIFVNMPELQALYLGENRIKTISAKAFFGLQNLRHLDISRNQPMNNAVLTFERNQVFQRLLNLVSLDLSFTIIQPKDAGILQQLSKKLQSLSVCHTGLNYLPAKIFAKTQLKYLDVSGNFGILGNENVLDGLQKKLLIVYAKDIGLKTLQVFTDFSKLEILDLDCNEIVTCSRSTVETLKNLKALNLDTNRFSTWWTNDVFSKMRKLKFLSLRNNNINFISEEMIADIANLNYIGLSKNFVVCNCYAREVFEIAYRNQNQTTFLKQNRKYQEYVYENGYEEINELIKNRNSIKRVCHAGDKICENDDEILTEFEGNFTFFDFDVIQQYSCLSVSDGKSIASSNTSTCLETKKKGYYDDVISDSWARLLFLLIIPIVIFPVLIFLYIFRRNLKYFCITMRNSATLSLINTDKVIDDGTIFHYDVFVSYCNGDRDWVLDYLLPHVEKGCNVSVCLHERDFQVGLSILENIVSCMDRSRSIMLVISKQFLESQWCQFEMHLAQHRLLETRREDLILVLLEEIPRRIRPTTLHYLMLTKTYILWPQKETDRGSFFKRVTRSLVANSRVGRENVSLA